jgi:hypothetical protein
MRNDKAILVTEPGDFGKPIFVLYGQPEFLNGVQAWVDEHDVSVELLKADIGVVTDTDMVDDNKVMVVTSGLGYDCTMWVETQHVDVPYVIDFNHLTKYGRDAYHRDEACGYIELHHLPVAHSPAGVNFHLGDYCDGSTDSIADHCEALLANAINVFERWNVLDTPGELLPEEADNWWHVDAINHFHGPHWKLC